MASLKRWAVRDPLGKMLMADTAALDAADPKTFKLVLKQPFPLLLDVLGKPNAPLPVMMPARLAATPADQRIGDPVGSGPFRFLKDQWRPGSAMVFERNPAYVPRKEAPDFLAGGKNVKIDQLTLRVMPDQSTGANALMAGEIDYMQYLPFDMLPLLEKDKGVKLMGLGGIHQFQGNFRLNTTPAVRQSGCSQGRIHEEFKRRIKTQTVLPSADTAAMLFWALFARGRSTCAKWMVGEPFATKPIDQPIDLGLKRYLHVTGERATPNSNSAFRTAPCYGATVGDIISSREHGRVHLCANE